MGTWFDTYHLSRPPLVPDEYDSTEVPPLRSRAADAFLVLGCILGGLVAIVSLAEGRPGRGLAIGLGGALTGGAGGQLACYAPEARAAWARGRKAWVVAFLTATVAGIALLVGGLTAS